MRMMLCPPSQTVIPFLYSCNMCHSNKLESVFECEVSRFLYDKGDVEYWYYEPVDLTEELATKAATGSTMHGGKFCQHILLSMTNAVSHILCLGFDFPENYTHINQVLNTHL